MAYQYRVLHFVVRKTAVQLVQQPTPLRPVQPINIVGVKWYHLRCRAGFSPARMIIARTVARTDVRASLRPLRLSGLRCSRVSAIDIYVNAYANAYAGNRWGYGGGFSAPRGKQI